METKRGDGSSHKVSRTILLVLLIMLIAVIVTLVVLFVHYSKYEYQYAVLVDAGSTSSKISIFRWQNNPFAENGYVEEVVRERIKPGISAFKDNPSGAFAQLKPEIQRLTTENIPMKQRNSTRLYLAATAGMRLVELDNALRSNAIIDDLQLNLQRIGLNLHNPYSDVRIMSGRDEGVNAWITVNYLADRLGTPTTPPKPADMMMGALDLGGASAQITFVPESQDLAPYTSKEDLYGSSYNVYSYSHLCYGKSVATQRIWAEVIGAQSTPEIKNPCLHKNHRMVVTKSDIFKEPCVLSEYATELVGSEITPNPALPESITFVGEGNPSACRLITNSLFPMRGCKTPPCMFGGVYRPPLRGKFNAFSGYTFVMDFLDFPTGGENLTRSEVRAKVDAFCRRDWNDISREHSADALKFVGLYCVDGVYVEALLAAYGFQTSDSWRSIKFAAKVANTTVSWAPGYVIDATGLIQSTAPKIHIDFAGFVVSVVLLSIGVVLVVSVLLWLCLKK